MTDKIKGLVEAAEKAFTKEKDEKTEALVKVIVQETLEKIEKLEKKIDEFQDEKKQLKLTIEDLKSGNLKLLKERLDKDKHAANVTNIRIVEVVQPIWIESRPVNPWHKPWEIWYGGNSGASTWNFTCDANSAKTATLGTYCTSSGKAITLR